MPPCKLKPFKLYQRITHYHNYKVIMVIVNKPKI
jgi:hypothetical protein